MDPSRDESLIFELLDFKPDVGDIGSASWFLHDLAREQDAQGFKVTNRFHFESFNLFTSLLVSRFQGLNMNRIKSLSLFSDLRV